MNRVAVGQATPSSAPDTDAAVSRFDQTLKTCLRHALCSYDGLVMKSKWLLWWKWGEIVGKTWCGVCVDRLQYGVCQMSPFNVDRAVKGASP